MEQHKSELLIDQNNIPTLDLGYEEYFKRAYKFALDNYKDTIDEIQNTEFKYLQSETFFSQYIWTVYTSGFNAKIVSNMWPKLVLVYNKLYHCSYLENDTIKSSKDTIRSQALEICNNKRKVDAIIQMSDILGEVLKTGKWLEYKNNNLDTPDKLEKLPFIGKITKNHLARNIGILNVVKEDLHLVRMGNHWGFKTGLELCKKIQETYNLELGIIGLIYWYSASQFGTK